MQEFCDLVVQENDGGWRKEVLGGGGGGVVRSVNSVKCAGNYG